MASRLPRIAVWVLTALVVGLAVRPVDAQQAQSVEPGSAAIWTDKRFYNIGDPIQYCFRIPIAGVVTITDFPADGTQRIIFNQSVNTTQFCQEGTVTPPSGHECLRLSYPLFGGRGQTQTCFTVLGSLPPPSALAIYTDRQTYFQGDPIDVCYRVPAPGPIRITDQINENTPTTFFQGYDDGTGGCIPGVITPPSGNECMVIFFTYIADGRTETARTCFQTFPR
jgi:hypothetical protein